MGAQRQSGATVTVRGTGGQAPARTTDPVHPADRARAALDRLRQGEPPFQATRLESLIAWARSHALAMRPIGGACCAPEWRSAWGPRTDLARFGARIPAAEDGAADLLVVMGSLTHKLRPWVLAEYEKLAPPRFVLAFGACACSGGAYDGYAVAGPLDRWIPVDVYVPGCPPRPEALIDGLVHLQEKIRDERPAAGRYRWAGAPAPTVTD